MLFANGRVVDAVLVLLLVELPVLALLRVRGRAVFRPLELVANAGAGAALLCALRAALRSSPWQQVSLCLLLALGFHVWDLCLRASARQLR